MGQRPQKYIHGGVEAILVSILMDTGATDSFFREFYRCYLRNKRKSRTKIMIADATIMYGDCDGVLPMFVMNTAQNESTGIASVLRFVSRDTISVSAEL